jgi:ATP-binding cassette, subfamily B, multidrug efflux pump
MQKQNTSQQLLFEVFFARFWVRLTMLTISASAAVFGILGPFFQKEFIDRLIGQELYLEKIFPELAKFFPSTPMPYLFFSFISIFLSLAGYQIVIYLGSREALILQRTWSQRLYEKILNLRTDALAGKQVGEIVSIYTTDLPGATILLEQSFPQAFGILFPLLLAPIMIMTLFQTPVVPTLLVMSAVVLFNLWLANRQSRFFYHFKKLAADRLGLVNEWIQNIRTLRMQGWVNTFENKIFQVRKVETKNRISMLVNGQTMNAVASSITFVLNLMLILSLVKYSESQVTPGALLALLWIVAIFLTRPFRQLPWFFTFVFDGLSSLHRTASLFAVDNHEVVERDRDFRKLKDLGAPDPAIKIEHLNLQIAEQKILDDLNFTVGEGEFIAIVGEVGSGKSMLLYTLLGETGAAFATYKIGENDARTLPLDQLRQFFTFVPQEGFIMSASLRENVAFEYDVDASVDEQVLHSLSRAQFTFTQERLQQGLDTEIGERGVNLSGGQKQRVSLARVDYYQSPIMLLDDCLSAVDVDTEKKLTQSLLCGAWRERTRILVTHRLSIINRADRIFFMENGRISDIGTFQELHGRSAAFREYTATIANETKKIEEVVLAPPSEPSGIGEK